MCYDPASKAKEIMTMSENLMNGLLQSLGDGITELLREHNLTGSVTYDIEHQGGAVIFNGLEISIDSVDVGDTCYQVVNV